MEDKVKVWLARDKGGALWLYQSIPNIDADEWFCKASCCKIDSSKFPSVKWEDDEPTEAYITLANEPQPKHEIDWEQRRYELTKTLFSKLHIYTSKNEIKHTIERILEFTDLFINEFKKQSDEL